RDRGGPGYPRATPFAARPPLRPRRAPLSTSDCQLIAGIAIGAAPWSGSGGDAVCLTRRGTLRGRVDGVKGLARGHEQPIALRPTEADVAANLRNSNAADELAFGVPDGDAAVADRASGIARAPQVAVDVGTHAIGTTFHAVDHEVAEQFAIRELVVAANVERVHVTLAARTGIAGAFAGADDVKLFVVGREAQPVGVGHLFLGDD